MNKILIWSDQGFGGTWVNIGIDYHFITLISE